MKYLLPFLFLLCLCGCASEQQRNQNGYEKTKINEKNELELKDHLGPYWIREFEYDGCQYVSFGRGQSFTVTHKGNCKYCAERKK